MNTVTDKCNTYQILTARFRLEPAVNRFLVGTETAETGSPGVRWMETDPGKVHAASFTLETYVRMMRDLF